MCIEDKQARNEFSRRQLAQNCFECCQYLLLSIDVASISTRYLHSFLNSFEKAFLPEEEAAVILTSILFFSCKMMEQFRSIRDVFNVVLTVTQPTLLLEKFDELYTTYKQGIIEMEHAVLRVMHYRYELDNPYQYVLNIARYLQLNRDVVNLVLRVLNDFHSDSAILTYTCAKISVACLMVAIEIHEEMKLTTSSYGRKEIQSSWCKEFGFTLQEIEDVSEVVLTAIIPQH